MHKAPYLAVKLKNFRHYGNRELPEFPEYEVKCTRHYCNRELPGFPEDGVKYRQALLLPGVACIPGGQTARTIASGGRVGAIATREHSHPPTLKPKSGEHRIIIQ